MIKIAIVVACGGLCSSAPAVNPAPDGGYPNDNTAEGDDALFSLTTGADNTAIGFEALYSNTTGCTTRPTVLKRSLATQPASYNTANGSLALYSNTTGSVNTATGFRALCLPTQPAATTRPTVFSALKQHNRLRQHGQRSSMRSIATQPAGDNTANGLSAL